MAAEMIMSFEEAKIREDLEMDVERELEEEIKEEICHLALRLQRLYQQQKDREARASTRPPGSKIPSEVNINIKTEGGTRIEIKEIKKQARSDQMAHVQRIMSGNPSRGTKKFDWMNSLRSGPSSKMDTAAAAVRTPRMVKMNASLRHRVNLGVGNTMLGWRD